MQCQKEKLRASQEEQAQAGIALDRGVGTGENRTPLLAGTWFEGKKNPLYRCRMR